MTPTPESAPKAEPEMVLVPREPTRAMLDAAAATPGIKNLDNMAVLTQLRDSGRSAQALDWGDGSPLEQAWRAMLAASPAQAQVVLPTAEQLKSDKTNLVSAVPSEGLLSARTRSGE